jgi:peptide/nickel transport system substrate-binding protein
MLARMSTNSMHILPESQASQDEISEPIGTGPFRFESREIESEFVMTKHDDYWQDGLPYFDEVVKQEITDDTSRFNRFRAGEVDFINDVPANRISEVSNDSSVRWEEKYPKIFYYLGLNCGEAPFDDRDARIALEYTFDRQEIIEASLFGHGKVPNSPSYPGSRWEHPDLEPRGKDLAAAEEHLSQSAYADGFSATIKIPDAYGPARPAATIIRDSASEIGIELDIQQITWSTWLSNVFDQGNFQATISTNLGLWYPDFGYYKIQHPDGAFYFTNWENEEYMSLVEDARSTYDVEERAGMYHQAAEILKEERSGRVPLFWGGYQLAATPSYKGPMGAPDGSTLRLWDNWFE